MKIKFDSKKWGDDEMRYRKYSKSVSVISLAAIVVLLHGCTVC